MDLSYTAEDEAFRAEIRGWMAEHLSGEVAGLKGPGQGSGGNAHPSAWLARPRGRPGALAEVSAAIAIIRLMAAPPAGPNVPVAGS